MNHVVAAQALERSRCTDAARARPRVGDRVDEGLRFVHEQDRAREDRDGRDRNEQLRDRDHDRDDDEGIEERRADQDVAIRVVKAMDVGQRRIGSVIAPAMDRVLDEGEEQPAGEDGRHGREPEAVVGDGRGDAVAEQHEPQGDIEEEPDPVVRFARHQPVQHASARSNPCTIAHIEIDWSWSG